MNVYSLIASAAPTMAAPDLPAEQFCTCGALLVTDAERSDGLCCSCADAPIGYAPTPTGQAVAFFLSMRADYDAAVDASRDREDAPDYDAQPVQIASANLETATRFLRAIGEYVCDDCRRLACCCPDV